MSKLSQKIEIINKRGLHARASAKFVKLAETFSSTIEVSKEEYTVCGTSIMGLMLLAAAPGDFIQLDVEGKDNHKAMEALVDLINNKFEEEM